MVKAANFSLNSNDMALFGGGTESTLELTNKLCGKKKVAVEHISKPGRLEKLWDKLCTRVSTLFTSTSVDKKIAVYHEKVLENAFNRKSSKGQEWLQDNTVFEAPKVTKKELSKPWLLIDQNNQLAPTKKADKVAAPIVKPKAPTMQGSPRREMKIV